jgi:hypothetical protein
MGIYLGANALGGGGTGGPFVTNPLELPKYSFQNLEMKYSNSAATTNAGTSAFWTYWDYTRSSATLTAADTYVTVGEVTSSPNGGFLINVIGNGVPAGTGTVTFRITVDGEEYIITSGSVPGAAQINWACIGSFLSGIQPQNSTAYDSRRSGYLNSYWPSVNNEGFLENGFYKPNGYTLGVVPIDDIFAGPKLRFQETIKVEVKSSVYSTATEKDRTGCTIVTI